MPWGGEPGGRRKAIGASRRGGGVESNDQLLAGVLGRHNWLPDELAQAADPDPDDRDRPALGGGDDRLGDGELVHQLAPLSSW